MLETSQLPFLLMLLDDDDPEVRGRVLEALAAFGADLQSELAQLPDPPEPATVAYIQGLIARHLRGQDPEGDDPEGMSFRPGQVVRHRRYGYRGVVVDANPVCEADETWYQGHDTQPDRDQPWYHVLVHNSMQVTYAAQSNLEWDDSGDEVIHPYVPYFFSEFRGGEYVRNDQPWPH